MQAGVRGSISNKSRHLLNRHKRRTRVYRRSRKLTAMMWAAISLTGRTYLALADSRKLLCCSIATYVEEILILRHESRRAFWDELNHRLAQAFNCRKSGRQSQRSSFSEPHTINGSLPASCHRLSWSPHTLSKHVVVPTAIDHIHCTCIWSAVAELYCFSCQYTHP